MCGLVGTIGTSDSALEVFLGLLNLQHRGQDGAGILSLEADSGQFNLQKGSGLVENVFSERTFRNLKGQIAIGHTRYATIGKRDPNMLQPFFDSEAGIGIGHNGNIVNCYSLRKTMSADTNFSTDSDSEVILKVLANELKQGPADADNVFAAINQAMNLLIGSYAVVGMSKCGNLFGFRDPNGIRPLVMGQKTVNGKIAYALASESVALNYLGYNSISEIGPGEAVFIARGREPVRKVIHKNSLAPCMFEWVYFARVESEIDNISVYRARFDLGTVLAEEIKKRGVSVDLVMPVPETSRIAAIAIAESLDVPFRELLIKNRYVNRTFILDGQQSRQEAIKRKLFPIASEIAGKRCLIVDDSIVRGNTAIQIVKLVRAAGATEITVVSTCPPISSPCYYGIDFPNPSELIAAGHSEEQIADILTADRVIYQDLEGLKKALGQKFLCTGCLNQEYPTDISQAALFRDQRIIDRQVQTK